MESTANQSNSQTENTESTVTINKASVINPPQPFVEIPYHGEHRRAVSCVSFAPASPESSLSNVTCCSGSADGTVKLWDISAAMIADAPARPPEDGNNSASPNRMISAANTLVGHSRGINDVAWSSVTAEYIATASDDRTLRLWDVATGDALIEFRGHTNFVFSIGFNPHSNLLVSGSFDETVKLWDVRTGNCLNTIPAHSDPVTSVQFNRDGTCIASASHDGLIRIWDTATGECLKTIFAEGNPPVSCARFTPNSKFILSSTLDSKLRLWDITANSNNVPERQRFTKFHRHSGAKCIKTYSSHVNTKYCSFSAFSLSNPLRQAILCGSEDCKAYLYDLQSRNVLQVLHGHTDSVLAVAAHDTKEVLATGGMTEDRTVRFWVPARTDGKQ